VKLCPEGVFLPPRMGRYVEVSAEIFAIFADMTPLVEPLSIDEAFLDVSGCRRLFGSAETIGHLLKDRVLQDVGLTASVGVAPNKFLAKLASDLEKPDGFVVFTAADAAARLAPLPVERLWGVGPATARALESLGLRTFGELREYPEDLLIARLGDHAAHLVRLAQGRDERPVVPVHEARSIGNEITFAEDIAAEDHLLDIVDHLAEKVGRRLRQHGLEARTVTLKARYPDFVTPTRSVTLPEPTAVSIVIRDAARDLLRRRLARRGRPLRLLGVTASNLGPSGGRQRTLFSDPTLERQRRLDSVLDDAYQRFGGKLRRGAGHEDEVRRHDSGFGHPKGDE
jgi:DNA polymerase-4